MTQSKKKEKPLYNLWQNTAWMMGNAWKTRKSVLFLCVAVAAGAVALSLTELFVTPAVLQKVETAAPFPELFPGAFGGSHRLCPAADACFGPERLLGAEYPVRAD